MSVKQRRVPSLLSLCCALKNADVIVRELPLALRLDPVMMTVMPIVALMQSLDSVQIAVEDEALSQIWLQRLKREFQKDIVPDKSPAVAYFDTLAGASIIANDASAILSLQAISPLPIHHLRLNGQHITSFPAAKLAIPSLLTLKDLELRWIKPAHLLDFCGILDLVGSRSSLQHLTLSDCLLDDRAFDVLIRHVPLSIRSLRVSNAALRQSSFAILANRILPRLRSLVLDESGAEVIDPLFVAEAVSAAHQLESLVLNPAPNCFLPLSPCLQSLSLDYEDADAAHLFSLSSITCLRHLRLANVPASQFQLPPDLTDLTLYQCKITSHNIELVLSSVRPDQVKSLDLSQNRLRRLCSPILQSLLLGSFRSLHRLSLSGCGFFPDCAFMEMIASSNVTDLNLSHNNLGEGAMSAVCHFLNRLRRPFDRLNLSSNRITSEQVRSSFSGTGYLRFLDLRWNLITTDEVLVCRLNNIAKTVAILPSALNLVCDAIQETSWADSMMPHSFC